MQSLSQFRYEDTISSLPKLNYASKFLGKGCHPGMTLKIIKSAGAGVLKAGRTGFEYGLSFFKIILTLFF